MTMRTLTLTAAAAALLCAAPLTMAQAQVTGTAVDTNATVGAHGDWTLKQREDWLSTRLNNANDDGSLDHHEYERVKQELRDIHAQEDALRDNHDGQLTDNETADLESRLDHVSDQIHWLRDENIQRPW